MTPMEIKSEKEWEQIVGRFADQVKMTVCLTDDGGADPRFCQPERYPLCAAIRANPEATTFICSKVNEAMLAITKKTLRPAIDMCDAGMFRVVVPIVRDGKMLGQVVACGVASAEEDEEIQPCWSAASGQR